MSGALPRNLVAAIDAVKILGIRDSGRDADGSGPGGARSRA
jgi:hypothetical protein